MAKRIYKIYGIANLIGPALPRDLKAKVNYSDYFGSGYTAKDVICNFVLDNYRTITESHRIVKCGDWYEAYVAETDMVVALPPSLGKRLSASDVAEIIVNYDYGLMLHGVPLHAMCGMKEVPSNIYDLRGTV